MAMTKKIASLALGLLFAYGATNAAQASIPADYTLKPGTLLSTHTPATDVCPFSEWRLLIEPHGAVSAEIEESATNRIWDLAGTYDSHGTFHLSGHESDDNERVATVDAQVESDGSMIFRMATIGEPSRCYNRTVYLPWFRNGNDFSPNGGGGGGGTAG